MELELARHVVFFLVLIVSAQTDIARNCVYNWVTFPGIALGLILAALSSIESGSWAPLLASALGFGTGLVALGLFWWKGQVGAGDVKMMAAVGALQGYPAIFAILFYSALVGSVLGIGMVLWKGELWKTLRGAGNVLLLRGQGNLSVPQEPAAAPAGAIAEAGAASAPGGVTIPFGFAIAVGGIWSWIEMHLR